MFFLIKLHFFQRRKEQTNTKEQNVNSEYLFVKWSFPQDFCLFPVRCTQFSQFYRAFKLFLVKNHRKDNGSCEKLGKVFHLTVIARSRVWERPLLAPMEAAFGSLPVRCWPTLADALTDKIRPRLENVFASV